MFSLLLVALAAKRRWDDSDVAQGRGGAARGPRVAVVLAGPARTLATRSVVRGLKRHVLSSSLYDATLFAALTLDAPLPDVPLSGYNASLLRALSAQSLVDRALGFLAPRALAFFNASDAVASIGRRACSGIQRRRPPCEALPRRRGPDFRAPPEASRCLPAGPLATKHEWVVELYAAQLGFSLLRTDEMASGLRCRPPSTHHTPAHAHTDTRAHTHHRHRHRRRLRRRLRRRPRRTRTATVTSSSADRNRAVRYSRRSTRSAVARGPLSRGRCRRAAGTCSCCGSAPTCCSEARSSPPSSPPRTSRSPFRTPPPPSSSRSTRWAKQRGSRDAAEMQPRCSREGAEMQPRCSRGVPPPVLNHPSRPLVPCTHAR